MLAVGVTLQAGATGAVRAIKMSAKPAGRAPASRAGAGVMAASARSTRRTGGEAPRETAIRGACSPRAVRIGAWLAAVALALWLLDLLGVPVTDWIRKLFHDIRSVPPEAIVARASCWTSSRPCSRRCRG